MGLLSAQPGELHKAERDLTKSRDEPALRILDPWPISIGAHPAPGRVESGLHPSALQRGLAQHGAAPRQAETSPSDEQPLLESGSIRTLGSGCG